MVDVLGLDPGMTRLGYGVIKSGEQLDLLGYGVFSHPRDPNLKFNEHLNLGIHNLVIEVPRLIDRYKPSFITAETVPAGKLGSNDSLIIAAITTCKVIAFQFGVSWIDIAASTAKKELTGDGRASKTVVRNAVFDLFPEVEQVHVELKRKQKLAGEKAIGYAPDVFDAIGIAVVGAKLNAKEEV